MTNEQYSSCLICDGLIIGDGEHWDHLGDGYDHPAYQDTTPSYWPRKLSENGQKQILRERSRMTEHEINLWMHRNYR